MDAVFATRDRITTLGADADRFAVGTTSDGSCHVRQWPGRVVVWTARGQKSTIFEEQDCANDLALGAGDVAWASGDCGNTYCDGQVVVAKTSGGAAKSIDEFANDGGTDPEGDYVGLLHAAP